MTRPASLLLASTNRGKLREVSAMLAGLPINVSDLTAHADWPIAEETAETFEGNARLKALHYAELAGGWVLADDSGLEVEALQGAPGVHSARYAGGQGDDAANNARLIAALAGVPPERRTARFVCVLALAKPGEVVCTARGEIAGLIVDEPRGENGFGYDPHFYVPEHGMTTAEMPPTLKNRISHRGQALQRLRPQLERLLRGS